MSLVEKAAAIRRELSMPPELTAAQTIAAACEMMGIVVEPGQTLPQVTDQVMQAVGCTCEAPPTTAAATASSSPPDAKASERTKAPGKLLRKLDAAASSLGKGRAKAAPCVAACGKGKATHQQGLLSMQGIKKVAIPAAAAKRVAAQAARRGEELTQEELEHRAGIETVQLPSEKEPREERAPALYFCESCPFFFTNPGALRSHEVWKHGGQRPKLVFTFKPGTFTGRLTTSLAVAADGVVRVGILINGKDRAQLEREETEARQQWEAAKVEREAEQNRRRVASQAKRDREEAVDVNLGRRGSDHRRQYDPVKKLKILDWLDVIQADGTIESKEETFEADKGRSLGCPYTTALKWLKPEARRKIRWGAAQDHAKKLLRIDETSRRQGKYVAMEKELFRLFRLRRAKARKTSSKCVYDHMIM
jgi:hypothetical protein